MAADHGELVGDAAMGHRHAGEGGCRDGTRDARDHPARHASGRARNRLLEAATEHEGIAALESHDTLAGLCSLDQQPVDRVLARGSAARKLRRVDNLDIGTELGEELLRSQPIGHDDIGFLKGPASCHGDQLGISGAPADEDDSRGALAVLGRGDLTTAKAGHHLVAHGRRPTRVPAAEHRDRQRAVPSSRGRPRCRLGGVVAPDAEHTLALRLLRDRVVDRAVVSGDDDVPRPAEVAVTVGTVVPDDLSGNRVPLDCGSRGGRDQLDDGTRLDQEGQPSLRHPPPAHDDDSTAVEAQPDRIVRAARVVGHRPTVLPYARVAGDVLIDGSSSRVKI